jgi:hypothetical protein
MKTSLKYIIALSLLAVSCQEIFFSGDAGSCEIKLTGFHSVSFKGIYDIILVQDSTDRLLISGKNDAGSVSAIVKNDTLWINDNRKMSLNPARNTLELHFTSLNYLVTEDPVNISNTGTIKADMFQYFAKGEISETTLSLNCNYLILYTSVNSLGYYYLKGKADYCDLSARYGSSIFAGDLECTDAEILNESVGDVWASVSGNMKAHIRGSGNIYCYGKPSVDIADQRGSGKLIMLPSH